MSDAQLIALYKQHTAAPDALDSVFIVLMCCLKLPARGYRLNADQSDWEAIDPFYTYLWP